MQKGQIIQLTLLTALAPVFWGTTYIVTTELLPPDRPFTAAVIRVLPAGLFLILWARELPRRGDILRLVILSFLNIGCFQALLFVAAYLLPGGVAAVVGSLQPLIMMLLVWAVEHRKPSWPVLLSGMAAVVGMSLMLLRPGAVFSARGIAAALAGAVSMAAGTYLASGWRLGLSMRSFTGWQLFLGGVMLLPVAAVFETAPEHLTAANAAGYFYLAFFGTLIAYFLWFRGLRGLSPVAVSVLGLLSPVTAVAAGWFFLGQNLGVIQLFGFFTVMVCIGLMQWLISGKRAKEGAF